MAPESPENPSLALVCVHTSPPDLPRWLWTAPPAICPRDPANELSKERGEFSSSGRDVFRVKMLSLLVVVSLVTNALLLSWDCLSILGGEEGCQVPPQLSAGTQTHCGVTRHWGGWRAGQGTGPGSVATELQERCQEYLFPEVRGTVGSTAQDDLVPTVYPQDTEPLPPGEGQGHLLSALVMTFPFTDEHTASVRVCLNTPHWLYIVDSSMLHSWPTALTQA